MLKVGASTLQDVKVVDITTKRKYALIIVLHNLTYLKTRTDVFVCFGNLKGVTKLDKKKLSNKHEKDIAQFFNGKVQIASGAIPLVGLKGDVITQDYLIECKATEKSFYTLKRKVVEKIEKEAMKCGRTPLLAIRVLNTDYILFRAYDFIDPLEKVICSLDLECRESVKLNETFLESSKDDTKYIRVGGKQWGLLSLPTFSEYFLEEDGFI